MSVLEDLVARSRRIGADPTLVVHGGGNTSSKLLERDFLGRTRAVMRIKGSGTDLRTIGADGFPGLFLEELEPLRTRAEMSDDDMVDHLDHCMVEPRSRRPSIETLLHAFLPAANVDHVHADAICALTNHVASRAAVREALGPDVAYVPYVRPGFELSAMVAAHAEADGVVLAHHGLVTWGETGEESLERTITLVRRAAEYLAARSRPPAVTRPDLGEPATAALLAALRRGFAHRGGRVVLAVDRGQRGLADRWDAEHIAASRATPDHILRIGRRGVVINSAAAVDETLERFAMEELAYAGRHAHTLGDGFRPHPARPQVVIVPGLGVVTAGRSRQEAAVTRDLARRSHVVGATVRDAFGPIAWLDEAEIFAFDYWPLELRKLAGVPPPSPLTGASVVVLAGAPPAFAEDLAARGAVVSASVEEAVAQCGGVDGILAASPEEAVAAQARAGDSAPAIVLHAGSADGTRLEIAPSPGGYRVAAGEDRPEAIAVALAAALPAPAG